MPPVLESQCNSTSPLDLEDIEDLFNDGPEAFDSLRRRNRENLVVPKIKKKARQAVPRSTDILRPCQPEVTEAESSFLPGSGTIFIRTWGCAHNSSDSEYMAGQLAAQGYT